MVNGSRVDFFLVDRRRWQPIVRAVGAESVFPEAFSFGDRERCRDSPKRKGGSRPHHRTGALDRWIECCARGDLSATAVGKARRSKVRNGMGWDGGEGQAGWVGV